MKPIELLLSKKCHLDRLANRRGAEGEANAVTNMENWIERPKGRGLKVLLEELQKSGAKIKSSGFDAISLPPTVVVDFTNAESVSAFLPYMIFIEIKTANQARVKNDFSGFFFALTESEIAAAEALGERHKVALFNKKSQIVLLTSVPEILSRARSTNWQVSVQL